MLFRLIMCFGQKIQLITGYKQAVYEREGCISKLIISVLKCRTRNLRPGLLHLKKRSDSVKTGYSEGYSQNATRQ